MARLLSLTHHSLGCIFWMVDAWKSSAKMELVCEHDGGCCHVVAIFSTLQNQHYLLKGSRLPDIWEQTMGNKVELKSSKKGKHKKGGAGVGHSSKEASREKRIKTLENKVKGLGARTDEQLKQLSDRNAALLRRTSQYMKDLAGRYEDLIRKTEGQMKKLSDKNSSLLKKTDDQLMQLSDRNEALLRKTGDQLEQLSQRNAALLRLVKAAK